MKKSILKVISVILALTMIISTSFVFIYAENSSAQADLNNEEYSFLTNKSINPDEISNAVVIPGVFQSKVRLYNDDGSLALNAKGEEYEAPFFLDDTDSIVKLALKKCLGPLLLTLFTQIDWGGKLAQNVADVLGETLGGKIKCDLNGDFINNVKADYYDGSVADLRAEGRTDDIRFIYDQIPLQEYSNVVGEDHLYYYSYESLGNINKIVDKLYELILKAAENSPTGKVNIIPISQGGTLANDLLDRYPQVGEVVDKIIYIVPALDGTVLLGEIYEKGFIDDDEALYRDIFPQLIDGNDDTSWTGSLINIVLRILPNKVVNDILDKAVDTLIEDYIGNSTCLWALLPQANYEGAANKYLSDADHAYLRRQTDAFHTAQVNSFANIQRQIDDYGAKVFNIVDYNSVLYPICDSWQSMNADGIIQLSSTSMGATSVAVDVPLPDDYVPAKGEKYVDKYNLVDAGTGLLPDSTFYFHNQNHEKTAQNDIILKLAVSLLTDNDFVSIESYPDVYPQFNEGRFSRGIQNNIAAAKQIDKSKLSSADAKELEEALEGAQSVFNNTVCDIDEFRKADARLDRILKKINGVSTEPTASDKISDSMNTGIAAFLKFLSGFLFNILGGKGFSDILRIF
ncbi:MAG: hypothetical protein IJK60_03010 [Clostridia bacterium]|nr:hypothetical protein [Clostridia bacterium]